MRTPVTALLQAVAPFHYQLALAYQRLGREAETMKQLKIKDDLERKPTVDLT